MKRLTTRRARRDRGQQLTEFTLLSAALLVMGGGLMHFAPDMLDVITIYIRGFYVILGFPLG
ncbi:hypothetical protein CYFUS_007234 [Cystobacter fuscus]|uniref:Uncharacterized protein n=2 Tax=Cystobacter fuscus TaxID=43 RepID=S9PA47_CYSF2|nr:hypothetical protein [Cystobacter fuscus]ATB41764.1 hypothetical protein CYFUS_007234 [Cystobacter fuscus]EPX59107.1 hypothetical protein D187_003484 [Cystobacter fuscus DSM 2262]